MCQAQSLPWGGWEIERHAGRWVQNNCCSYPRQWQFCGSEVGQPRLLLFPDQDFEGGLEAYGKDQGVYASGVLRNYVDFGRIWGSLGTRGAGVVGHDLKFFHSNRHYQDSEGTQSTIWGDSSGDTLRELEEAGRGRPPYQTCLLGSILRLPQPKLTLTSWWLLNWSAEAPAILKHLDLVFAPPWLFLCGQLSSLLDLM